MTDTSTMPPSENTEKMAAASVEAITAMQREQWQARMTEERKRYEENRSGAFATALAAAQSKFKPVKRTRLVQVRPRDQSKAPYSFAYAPLDVILDATLPALNAEGFALTQAISKSERGVDYVRTELSHTSGVRFNLTPIFSADAGPQAYNSALTYARRAGVTLLLCIAAEEDDDGNDAEGNEADHRPAKPAPGRGPVKPAPARPPQRGTRVVLDPGETTHLQSAEDQLLERQAVGGQRDAFTSDRPRGDAYGRRADQPAEAPKGQDLVAAEGKIADAVQEFHEAALEGRRGGIESIWEEVRGDEYIATETWNRLKERHPDSFATVSAVLRPREGQPVKAPAKAGKK